MKVCTKTMTYTKTKTTNNRNRAYNIIWLNPPYSQNVKTNIGIIFKLTQKHFPYKILNALK